MMAIINTVLVQRPAQTLNVDWGNSRRLVVVIVQNDISADRVTACVVDPDHPNVEHSLTFDLTLPRTQIEAFLKRFANGQPFGALRDGTCASDAVDVSTSQPPTQGPKVREVFLHVTSLGLHARLTA